VTERFRVQGSGFRVQGSGFKVAPGPEGGMRWRASYEEHGVGGFVDEGVRI